MPRLRARHLKQRIDITRLAGEGAESDVFTEPVMDVRAYVEQKTRLVVDRRNGSDTIGQQVTSTTFVVVLLGDEAAPRDLVTVWKGTPRERTSQVIDSAWFEYAGAPSHVELYLE